MVSAVLFITFFRFTVLNVPISYLPGTFIRSNDSVFRNLVPNHYNAILFCISKFPRLLRIPFFVLS